ncbi:hypothetical protein PN498_01095 [Oscillatoria sp. CS-180]|uniref:RHS repeat-associated core domain-containing protein n=1 Tax=Oscillatoria sp. CS-180 TaxID=3021720 RepID=UPI00232E948B|nr:RHS repeat-associated core domain-containing protein [Oscillatoria sp. CS-180]MDB9524569.1 hypothetical protein [Oscillatoria sp. CS-180]
MTTDYIYDEHNRLERLSHNNGSADIAFYDFDYDLANRIQKITDVDGTTDYTYNKRNELTGADYSNVSNPDENYDYDANGNRIQSHLHNTDYVTGTNNQLSTDGVYTYTYDDEGNMTTQTEIATGNERIFVWDHLNRLIAVIDEDSNDTQVQQVDYTYDVMNRRIAKSIDGATTHFVYDRDNVLLEFEGSATTPSMRYLHEPQVDQVLAQEDSGGTQWLLGDHLGTIKDFVDDSGNLLNHRTFDSYGNLVSETNSTVDSRYAFTGREYDEETGLYYYRARYYNGELGRFISQDPIGFQGGDSHLYRYVNNYPVNSTDPSGLFKVEIRYRGASIATPVVGDVADNLAPTHHADVVITDRLGQVAVWAGPRDGFIVSKFDNDYNIGDGFYVADSSRIQLVYDDGTPCEDLSLETAIRNEFLNITAREIAYETLGPNSNSAAFHVVRTLFDPNIKPIPDVTPVGWEVPLSAPTPPFNPNNYPQL